jgi:uncharacterized protein
MKKSIFIKVFILLLFLLCIFYLFMPNNITSEVNKTNDEVLTLLKKQGIKPSDIVFEKKDLWRRGRVNGATITQVIDVRDENQVDSILDALSGKSNIGTDVVKFERGKGVNRSVGIDIRIDQLVVVSLVFIWEDAPKEQPVSGIEKKTSRIAIILDDFGYTDNNLNQLKQIKAPVVLAVLPGTPHAEKVLTFAEENGFETILHLPMEPESGDVRLEEDTLLVGMDAAEVRRIVEKDIAALPGIVGASNHMGSKATQDVEVMTEVINVLKEKNLFFLDSLTSRSSVGMIVSEKLELPVAKRDIFIDNELTYDSILKQMKRAEKIALNKGIAIVIGHDRGATVSALARIIPDMEDTGIVFISLSELIKEGS